MMVQVTGDRLSVALRDTTLAEALRVIAELVGFGVVVNASLDDGLSLAFADLPLEQGLKRLLGAFNALFIYTATGALEEVRVYPRTANPSVMRGALTLDVPRAGSSRGAEEDPTGSANGEHASRLPSQPGDPDPARRLAVAIALSGTGETATAIGALLDLLSPHYESAVREQALRGLSLFEPTPVVPLAAIAISDEQRSLQLEALEILSQRAGRDPSARLALWQVADLALDIALREKARALLQSLSGFHHR